MTRRVNFPVVDECQHALASLVAALQAAGLDDLAARSPSRLPGWSNGHVLAHIALNADGVRRMVEAALSGHVADMYPSAEARTADIEQRAGTPATTLVSELTVTEALLQEAWRRLDGVPTGIRWTRRWGVQPWPVTDLAFIRLREICVHSTDLDVGPADGLTPERMWSTTYVHAEFARQVGALIRRVRAGVPVTVDIETDSPVVLYRPGTVEPNDPVEVAGSAVEVVAWMLGRSEGRRGWPALEPWDGVP